MKSWLLLIGICTLSLLLVPPRLHSLNPSLDVSQYAHTAWTSRDGFSVGATFAIAQTPDALNRLTQIGSTKTASLSNFAYTLGPAGNRLSVVDLNGRSANYGYDNVYRLISETVSGDPGGNNNTTEYTYDNVGNRDQLIVNGVMANVYSYDANDRLTSDNWDSNGNTIASLASRTPMISKIGCSRVELSLSPTTATETGSAKPSEEQPPSS